MTGNSKQNITSIANLARRISIKKTSKVKENLDKGKWVWNTNQ